MEKTVLTFNKIKFCRPLLYALYKKNYETVCDLEHIWNDNSEKKKVKKLIYTLHQEEPIIKEEKIIYTEKQKKALSKLLIERLKDLRRLRRNLATWHYLKYLSDENGIIYNWRSNIKLIAEGLGVTPRTVETRLKQLQSEGYITKGTNSNLYLCSWQKAMDLMDSNIEIGKNDFKFITTTDTTQLEQLMDCILLEMKYKEISDVVQRRLNIPELNQELKKVCSSMVYGEGLRFFNLNRETVLKCQILAAIRGTKVTSDVFSLFNSDININYQSLSKWFGFTGYGSAAYRKSRWTNLGLATITPREYYINNRTYQDAVKIGTIWWSKKVKRRMLTMPDEISLKINKLHP
jgi:DNA-binding Lrp family transcriptional regulator